MGHDTDKSTLQQQRQEYNNNNNDGTVVSLLITYRGASIVLVVGCYQSLEWGTVVYSLGIWETRPFLNTLSIESEGGINSK